MNIYFIAYNIAQNQSFVQKGVEQIYNTLETLIHLYFMPVSCSLHLYYFFYVLIYIVFHVCCIYSYKYDLLKLNLNVLETKLYIIVNYKIIRYKNYKF